MTEGKAQRIVLGASTLTFLTVLLNSVIKTSRLPSMRFFFGSGVLFVGLSALADARPREAAPFAALIATTAVLSQGGDVIGWLVPDTETAVKLKSGLGIPLQSDAPPFSVPGKKKAKQLSSKDKIFRKEGRSI